MKFDLSQPEYIDLKLKPISNIDTLKIASMKKLHQIKQNCESNQNDQNKPDQQLLTSISEELKYEQKEKITKYKTWRKVKFTELELIKEDVINEITVDQSENMSSDYNLEFISLNEEEIPETESEEESRESSKSCDRIEDWKLGKELKKATGIVIVD